MPHILIFIFVYLVVVPAVIFFLRRKSAALEKSKDVPMQKLNELGRLTGELAHEIKNPLSTIKVNLKLTAEELEDINLSEPANQSSDRVKRALRKIGVIEREADRLEHILDGFLRYIDQTKLSMSAVNVNELIGDMMDFYNPQAHTHSIRIHQGLSSEPLICKVDSDMLKQVILNLFINAQQAMDDGGELMVRTERQGRSAIITVSDTGCGIEPKKLHKIFDAYYSSRSRGSGLGLATAEKIIEAHNGTINVNSEQGKGTSFTIKLPLENN